MIHTWHMIEGEAGCRFAREHQAVALVVDSLRASATAAMLLHHGASSLILTATVEDARQAALQLPEALLYGERNGLPPDGFHFGNSPQDAFHAARHLVIFTTTTGVQRLLSAWGSPVIMMASPLNASAAAQYALRMAMERQIKNIVLIPAGLATDPEFDAQEDWAGAVAILRAARDQHPIQIGEGMPAISLWDTRIANEGLTSLFDSAPHSAKLRAIGMDSDIAYCSQLDITAAIPLAIHPHPYGIQCANASQ